MSPKVVQIADRINTPNEEVVACLEGLLERARAGEVRGIAFGAACPGGHDANGFVIGDGSIAQLVLGMERAKARLLMEGM